MNNISMEERRRFEAQMVASEGRVPPRSTAKKVKKNVDAPDQSQKKESISQKIIEIAEGGNLLFHDTDGTGYIAIRDNDGSSEVVEISSTRLKKRLYAEYYDKYDKVASEKGIKDAINSIAGKAEMRGEEIKLHNRVAWSDGNIYYDMSNKNGDECVVGDGGWEIQPGHTPRFKRWAHQSPQVKPSSEGDIDALFELVNVREEDKLLTLVHLVSSLVPEIPHPMLVLTGEQGSAKSSASKILKALVDPSVIDTVAMPRDADRMHQILSKHWYLMFDNVSYIEQWQSDLFCRAVTGQADVVREYFTTADDHIFSYKICLGANGITKLVTAADLLDRALNIELVPIPSSRRKSERAVDEEFDRLRPHILAGMFDVLSKAIKVYPEIKLNKLPRMADFAEWGCAITIALGRDPSEFLKDYKTKEEDSIGDALEAAPVGGLIERLMADRDEWEGTMTELRGELMKFLVEDGENARNVRGMKNVEALGRARDKITPILRRIGIDWVKLPRTMRKKAYKISRGEKYDSGNDSMTGHDGSPYYVTPNKKESSSSSVGNTKGETRHDPPNPTYKTKLPQSKQLDYDNNTAERIIHSIREAISRSLHDESCTFDEIVAMTRGLQRNIVHMYLTKYADKLSVDKNLDGLYYIKA